MKLLKVIYEIDTGKSTFIPIDGKRRIVCPMLEASCVSIGEEYEVTFYTMKRLEPNNPKSDYKHGEKTALLAEGTEFGDSYTTTEWSYLHGVENVSRSYRAVIIDDEEVLAQGAPLLIRAMIYDSRGEHDKANELMTQLLGFNCYIYIDSKAHIYEGQRYESGIGRDKDLARAFYHYLLARSAPDIIRFMDMGYGGGAPIEDYHRLSWDIYHSLMILHHIGYKELAYNEMCLRANHGWCYTWEEKESADAESVEERRVSAQARLQAAKWIIDREDLEIVKSGNLVLFLGAYYAYKEHGHEDRCTYYDEDSGVGFTSEWRAIDYLKAAAERGEVLAQGALALVEKAKAEG